MLQFAILPLLLLPGPSAPAPAPEAVLESADFDAGTIALGSAVKHAFVIKNGGTAPLTIKEVKPSCGCTSPDYTRSPIAPGQTGEVTLEIHPYGPGEFVKTAAVVTDDPVRASLTLTVRFKAVRMIEAVPDRLFQPAAPAFEASVLPPLTLRPGLADKVLSSPAVSGAPAGTSATLTEVTPGREYRLDFRIAPGHRAGESLEGHLTVQTGLPEQPQLEIPYTILFAGKVRLIPDHLTWGVIPAAMLKSEPETYTMRILVDYPGGAGRLLKLGKPVSSTSAIHLRGVKELVPGQRYELTVALDPATPPGEIRGTITLPSSEPTMRKIEIPVVATVR